MLEYLLGMFPPDWSILPSLLVPVAETLYMAVIAVLLATVVALPLSFCAAKNTSPNLIVYLTSRGVINLARGLPTLLWALLFVIVVGLGPRAGILAMMCHCVGTLGKHFLEALESVEPRVVEILEAMWVDGASKWQAYYHGLLFAVAPLFTSYVLYYFEWAVRTGTILGIVGAGGLGTRVLISIHLFRRKETAAIVLVILALVVVVDSLSRLIRRRLI